MKEPEHSGTNNIIPWINIRGGYRILKGGGGGGGGVRVTVKY